ncbi:MAG: tripartite tricarboxylate transporter permease, partial [Methanothrix sp.]|nr:tripartite tricarboxylate transporter permease [Methanothrix sp.]
EAVRLSALGSAASTVVSLMLIPPLSWFFSRYYEGLSGYIGLLLLGIALLMLRSERGPLIEGQGSLAHWKYRGLASLIFLTSGCLGIFAFENEGLLSSPIGVEPEVLLPLLSGLFGAPSLLLSMTTASIVPEQQGSEIDLPPGRLARAVIAGSLGGSVVAWIPGISPSVAAVTARLGSPSSPEEFLVSIAGVNTANALFSLVALYVIQRPRSGAAAAIRELVALDQGILVQMMMVVVLVAFVSYLAVIGTACIAARAMPRLNYRGLCSGVLALLAGMTAAFTGPFGLLIFLLSTVVGLIAPLAGVHRIHAMGVLMLPLILQYI